MLCKLLPTLQAYHNFQYNIIHSMYWSELILNVLLVIASLQILLRVDFIPLTPEEIEKIEIEELKHRMEVREH